MHLSIETPILLLSPGQGEVMWRIFMVFDGMLRPFGGGGGGVLRIFFAYSSNSESMVGL